MKSKKGQVLLILILVVLVAVLVFLLYTLYQYIPSEPQPYTADVPQQDFGTADLPSEVGQFYPNMKFNHNRLSYNIEEGCSQEKKDRMIEALKIVSENVDEIEFYPSSKNVDINVTCTTNIEGDSSKDFFIAGEGGAEQIIQTRRYNVITRGMVLLFKNPQNSMSCNWPNVELHELMHVFGFEHSRDGNSLTYPYLSSCDQKLDESIIEALKELYKEENLADLYFEEARAIKHGRYLDFNVTIKNSGTIDAENVFLGVFDGNKEVDRFPMENIDFGAGVTFSVSNVKLESRSSSLIRLVIDPDSRIKEIDKENNEAALKFE
jgi:hypothetical protein